tara:strand:+ start:70 stop:426 length:357 start_codon:yes stop_codon:yes gene_type:complete
VSFGAIIGANTRFIIYRQFEKLNLNNTFCTLLVNSSASFSLGLFVSLFTKIKSLYFTNQLALLFLIGFLGSLSTFSTFIYDVFYLFIRFKFSRALNLLIISFSLGLIALLCGFLIGNL